MKKTFLLIVLAFCFSLYSFAQKKENVENASAIFNFLETGDASKATLLFTNTSPQLNKQLASIANEIANLPNKNIQLLKDITRTGDGEKHRFILMYNGKTEATICITYKDKQAGAYSIISSKGSSKTTNIIIPRAEQKK